MNYKKIYDLFLENKDRFIDKNDNLDMMQKQITKDFFKNHPTSENQIDWNKSASLTYKDFEKIFNNINNSKNALKKASKEDLHLLFKNRNDCKVIGENDKFIFVLPLSYEACIWMDSFDCGGGGAKWCIGYEKSKFYYDKYYKEGNAFILAFNKYPTNLSKDLKYMIQVDPIKLENNINAGECWPQNDSPKKTYKLTIEESDRNVEGLTGITKEQLIKYGKEYRAIIKKQEKERKENLAIFVYKEVLWKDFPDLLKNSKNSLILKILDPENVVLGENMTEGTLGYFIAHANDVKLDFSPSDFSNSKLLDDTSSMFCNCSSLLKICKLPASIINAYGMFSNCTSLVSIDTSNFTNVKNAASMFNYCESLVTIDTSVFTKVTNSSNMFSGCASLISIDTAAFANVIEADYMFSNCVSLTTIDNFTFKHVINNMGSIFSHKMLTNCSSLKKISFSSDTEYIEQYERLITNNEGRLSYKQIENAKLYSNSPVIYFEKN